MSEQERPRWERDGTKVYRPGGRFECVDEGQATWAAFLLQRRDDDYAALESQLQEALRYKAFAEPVIEALRYADDGDRLSTLKVDVSKDGKPRQWLVFYLRDALRTTSVSTPTSEANSEEEKDG